MHWKAPKIHVISFTVIFALLQWSRIESAISPRYACTYMEREEVFALLYKRT